MGKNDKKMPFSIISDSEKLKKLKKLGWKGYLLFLVIFILVGGIFAYYQRSYQSKPIQEFKPEKINSSEEYNLGQKMTLETISQSKSELKKETENSRSKQQNTKKNNNIKESKAIQTTNKETKVVFNKLVMPINGEVSSVREWYKDEILDAWKYNEGMNIIADIGTKVKAVQSGIVDKIIRDDYRGATIIIKHNSDFKTLYSNLEKVFIEQGEKLNKGKVIATLGDSGVENRGKLHFEIIKRNKKVSPRDYID